MFTESYVILSARNSESVGNLTQCIEPYYYYYYLFYLFPYLLYLLDLIAYLLCLLIHSLA